MATSADVAINTSKNRIWLMSYFYGLRREFLGRNTGGGIANEIYFNDMLHASLYRW